MVYVPSSSFHEREQKGMFVHISLSADCMCAYVYTVQDVDSEHAQRKSSSDSYVSPIEESADVWKKRTPDPSSNNGSNAHYT